MSKKISLSTDWHFGKSNGKFDKIILDGIYEQCKHAKENNIKILINLGDTLDTKQSITTYTLRYLAKAFEILNETFDKIYIIVGNHDISKKTYKTDGHNLSIFEGYTNVEIIDTPTIIEIYNKKFYLLPFISHELLKEHKFQKANYMLGHFAVQGFMLNQFIKADEGLNANIITNMYEHIFLGHFHKRQVKDKITYIGNLVRFFYGEGDDKRGWTILDCDNGNVDFIEYEHARMYKFKLSTLMEIDNLSTIFRNGDNLKLVIDKQLKYVEMEEFKSKLILDYGINELVLDDQYYAFDIDEDLYDESDEDSNKEYEPTYMEYLIDEMKKINGIDKSEKAMQYLQNKFKDYQE